MAAARVISRLHPKNSILFVCDLQDKFSKTIPFFPAIVEVSRRVIAGAKLLDVKTIATEQYPKGLGRLVPELGLSSDVPIFEKTLFSMCLPSTEEIFKPYKNVIITCLDLLEKGHNVHVVVDGVASRSPVDRKYAFKQLDKAGAILTTSEAVLLALCQDASNPKFKPVQKLILESAPDTGLLHSKM